VIGKSKPDTLPNMSASILTEDQLNTLRKKTLDGTDLDDYIM